MWDLASPERGGAPKGRRGCLPLESRRRWWRGLSHLTVRTVPKCVRLRSLFWNGGGEIIPFPDFYGNRRFALRDNYISTPLSGFARLGRCPRPRWGAAPVPVGALPQTPPGLCPRPRKPFFEEKGLEPKNLFSFFLLPFLLITKATALFLNAMAFFFTILFPVRALLLVFHLLL